jgi:hypothetical protein
METKRPIRGGGRAYHSALAPHFEAIRQWRKERKTWKEIAELLFVEKNLRVTLYAPYRFMRRCLKRKANWEEQSSVKAVSPPVQTQRVPPRAPNSRPSAPVLPTSAFHRPDHTTFNSDEYL